MLIRGRLRNFVNYMIKPKAVVEYLIPWNYFVPNAYNKRRSGSKRKCKSWDSRARTRLSREAQASKPMTAHLVNVGPGGAGTIPVVPWPCPPGLPGQRGGLVAPFVEATMGWVVQLRGDRVLHVREAVQTNQEGEQLRIQQGCHGEVVQLELEEDERPGQPYRRMTGKQPLGTTPCLGGTPVLGSAPLPARGEYSSSSPILRPKTSTSEMWKDAPERFPRSSTAASASEIRAMVVDPAGRAVKEDDIAEGRWLYSWAE